MILYNIGEVTDRTIHYFSFITLRGRRTTHAYSLLLSSFIHPRVHTPTHTYTHVHTYTRTYSKTHPYSPTCTHSPNYSIYSATVSFASSSRIFANRQSCSNVLSLVTSRRSPLDRHRLALRRFVSRLTRIRLINCAARVTRVSTARANLL